MAISGKTELANLIPELWSPDFYDELRKNLIIAPVFERVYEGVIANIGDTVRVNQINKGSAEILTDDKQEFASQTASISQFTIEVTKRAVSSYEITDLAQLQSQAFENMLRETMVYELQEKIENDVIAALLPSTSAPDHDIAPASAGDLAAADVAGMRTLFSKQAVPVNNRFLFLDPQYYGDVIQKTAFSSSDFIPAGSPASSGAISSPLYGFTVAESQNLSADVGYAVHPSALQMVMQQGLRIKLSDLHAQNKFGFLISADIVYGFKLFDNKRIIKISG